MTHPGLSTRLCFRLENGKPPFLLDGCSHRRDAIWLHNRLPRGIQVAWRHSELVDDQCGQLNTNVTYGNLSTAFLEKIVSWAMVVSFKL